MANKNYPWYTSNDIVAAVQRKISFPISQNTFSADDILEFAQEELMIGQVPQVMEFHQEYFVVTAIVPLQSNTSNYPIPERAIGLRLRDIFYIDNANNFVEMTRVNSDDMAFFQANIASSNSVYKFYLQGNDIIVTPSITEEVFGAILMVYFLRPNQLVANDQAATIQGFQETITINNVGLAAGDTLTLGGNFFNYATDYLNNQPFPPDESFINYQYTFGYGNVPPVVLTATTGTPLANQFLIGATSAATAINLTNAINGLNMPIYSAVATGNVITLSYQNVQTAFNTSNVSNSIVLSTGIQVVVDQVPISIVDGSTIDILQTKGGHKTLAIDIQLGNTAISGNVITLPNLLIPVQTPSQEQALTPSLPVNMSPINMVIGDYLCQQYNCIIPSLPTDIHISLIERTCARILAAMGDQAGLQMSAAQLQDINKAQGPLLDNRVEGSPMKVLARHSLLRFGKMGPRRNLS
jgi:hypothetical protein